MTGPVEKPCAATVDYDYLTSIEADGRALLGTAADVDLDLPIPTCPGWTLRDLVDHVSGASRWMSTCVSSGLTAQERILRYGVGGTTPVEETIRRGLFAEQVMPKFAA